MLQRLPRPVLSPCHPQADQEVERENESEPHRGAEVSKGAALPADLQVFWILTPDQLLPDSRIPWGKSHSHPYYKFLFLGPRCFLFPIFKIGFPRWLSNKDSACKAGDMDSFNPWVGKIPWRRKWQPTPVFLPGESQGQRSLAGYIFFFNWSIIALPCCVSFCCYANQYMHPPSHLYSPQPQAITEHGAEIPVLDSRFPLAICFTRGNSHGSFPISQLIPLTLRVHTAILFLSYFFVSIPVLQIGSSEPFFP